MSLKTIKFRNILGELTVAKLYRGEHLGVTAPANFDLRFRKFTSSYLFLNRSRNDFIVLKLVDL